MTIQEWAVLHKKELIAAGTALFIAILFYIIFLYLPKPDLNDSPTTTKEATITLHGTASPKVGIAIFDGSGNALVIVNTNAEGAFTLEHIPVGEGKTTFTIRAIASGWRSSFPRTITIEKDTTAPALTINDLKNATVTGSNTVLSGKAEPGSTITVNGVKTTVNSNGTWTATVALQPGSNAVTVAATDTAGNTLTETQTIQYQPSATASPTGTATVATSTTAVSAGSLLPSLEPSLTSGVTGTVPTTGTTAPTQPAITTSPTPIPVPTTVAPTPILSIITNAWVSNTSPNERANETVYATVKDNYGRPVTNASVIARVYFKSGMVTYSLVHTGNGNYSASFKLNDKFIDGYRVNTEIIATLNGFVSTANTSFTPQSSR